VLRFAPIGLGIAGRTSALLPETVGQQLQLLVLAKLRLIFELGLFVSSCPAVILRHTLLRYRPTLLAVPLVCMSACGHAPERGELHVAAAANLSMMFETLARACEKSTGVKMTPSFGATTQLAQQIENGGPFDLFLAADAQHVDMLGGKGLIAPGSRAVYARGRLVIWAPRRADIMKIEDLGRADVKAVAIAKPELAPYGQASIDALTAVHLWPAIENKIVYAQNIQAVKQFADSSNVDAAFTALGLVKSLGGHYILVSEKLHKPIDQAMCIVKTTVHADLAQRAESFILGPEGRAIFDRFGYSGIAAQ
jgi:molybdate transport system substrate-binding protein